MKRYKLNHRNLALPMGNDPWPEMIESDDGRWVRYEDVNKKTDKAFTNGYWKGYNARALDDSIQRHPQNYPLCCCLKCATDPHTSWWVCPAHGYYKKK